MLKVYHQLGYREKWNFEVFDDYNIGEGFIFSPVNYAQDKLQKLSLKYKNKGLFDPQCYFPDNNPRGQLATYNYFPQNICGIDTCATIDILKDDACDKIAQECIDFQIVNGFEGILIPYKRYFVSNPYEVIEKNNEQFVKPFFKILDEKQKKLPIYLTIVIGEEQLKFKESRDEMLSWITGLEIEGVYLIFQYNGSSKQIKDEDFLFSALLFIDILKKNDLKVIIGYTNTEALLYLIAEPDIVTIGSYENLRKFTQNRFIENPGGGRSPIARLYSNVLLNWIPAGIINSIRENFIDKFEKLFEDNNERPYKLSSEFNWHFTKPELYKHYFISFYNQIKSFPVKKEERIEYLVNLIDVAIKEYKDLNIKFDSESNYDHLVIWKKVIERYKNRSVD